MAISRRDFLASAAVGSLGLGLEAQQGRVSNPAGATTVQTKVAHKPVLVCAANGFNHLDAGYEILRHGGDTLEAALRVVREQPE